MENAADALVIAGGVLIGIIIISVAVFVFSSAGNFATTVDDSTQETIIATFNEDFEQFVGRTDITVYDIISIINLAQNYNTKENEIIVDVVIDKSSWIIKKEVGISEKMEKLEKNQNTYSCVGISYSSDTQKVNKIEFKTNLKNN